jgi:tRNA pseudouridine55 synthase
VTQSGLLVVDKPGGMTSHDVVARVRRALGTRKVGHAGTLDPMATGVLVIGVEKGTRLLGHLALRDKEYLATIRLGSSTVTDDRDGELVSSASQVDLDSVSDAAIRAGLAALVGSIEQRPSAVSAVKVDGRRAYDRVRAGEDVQLAPRLVSISRIAVLRIARAPGSIDVAVDVECSTGTYIRAIARDLGVVLGVGGHLTDLRRTRVGPFDAGQAVSLDHVQAVGDEGLIGMRQVAGTCFPTWVVPAPAARAVRQGQRIAWRGPSVAGPIAIVDEVGSFLALAHDDEGTARYLAVFAEAPGSPAVEA